MEAVKENVYYKIVEYKNGQIKPLFHGRKKPLVYNKWLQADIKQVRDGNKGKWYISGWHIFKSYEIAEKFFYSRFRIHKNRTIVKCHARNLRPKAHSKADIYLAEKIRFIK